MKHCPKCHEEVEDNFDYCWNCQYDFTGTPPENNAKTMECLRCHVPMEFQGNFRFHEGSRMGALGNVFELFTNRESFNLYSCPSCGKVEFFLP